MLQDKKIAVTMPGYYAAKTIKKTVDDIPREIVDHIILSDDNSKDDTIAIARTLDIEIHVNAANLNYGGNVKNCLQLGLDSGADVIVLLHPDYQYSPKLVIPMASMINQGTWDLCLASRISGRGALSGGMPIWKYLANWVITNYMDCCLGRRHTEYHTGFRAYSRRLLETIDFHALSNDFIFDNELLIAAVDHRFQTCEISCPTVYEEDSSSINFIRALKYGVQCCTRSTKALLRRICRTPAPKGHDPQPILHD